MSEELQPRNWRKRNKQKTKAKKNILIPNKNIGNTRKSHNDDDDE